MAHDISLINPRTDIRTLFDIKDYEPLLESSLLCQEGKVPPEQWLPRFFSSFHVENKELIQDLFSEETQELPHYNDKKEGFLLWKEYVNNVLEFEGDNPIQAFETAIKPLIEANIVRERARDRALWSEPGSVALLLLFLKQYDFDPQSCVLGFNASLILRGLNVPKRYWGRAKFFWRLDLSDNDTKTRLLRAWLLELFSHCANYLSVLCKSIGQDPESYRTAREAIVELLSLIDPTPDVLRFIEQKRATLNLPMRVAIQFGKHILDREGGPSRDKHLVDVFVACKKPQPQRKLSSFSEHDRPDWTSTQGKLFEELRSEERRLALAVEDFQRIELVLDDCDSWKMRDSNSDDFKEIDDIAVNTHTPGIRRRYSAKGEVCRVLSSRVTGAIQQEAYTKKRNFSFLERLFSPNSQQLSEDLLLWSRAYYGEVAFSKKGNACKEVCIGRKRRKFPHDPWRSPGLQIPDFGINTEVDALISYALQEGRLPSVRELANEESHKKFGGDIQGVHREALDRFYRDDLINSGLSAKSQALQTSENGRMAQEAEPYLMKLPFCARRLIVTYFGIGLCIAHDHRKADTYLWPSDVRRMLAFSLKEFQRTGVPEAVLQFYGIDKALTALDLKIQNLKEKKAEKSKEIASGEQEKDERQYISEDPRNISFMEWFSYHYIDKTKWEERFYSVAEKLLIAASKISEKIQKR